MQTVTVENDKTTGSAFAHLAARAAEGRMLCEDITELGKRKAERLIGRAHEAGEDCLDETTHYVKRHPWNSLGLPPE